MPASAQPAGPSGNDLFGAMTTNLAPAPAPAPAPAAPSADLFDLMGPTQTQMSSSQSLNFNMTSMQSMSTMGMPQSMSQVLHSYQSDYSFDIFIHLYFYLVFHFGFLISV